jgi:dTDP-glucose 4,6-dehydratase
VRLLVTGAAGFIGSNFIKSALVGQYKRVFSSIVGIDSMTYAGIRSNMDSFFSNKNFTFIEGDICSYNLMNSEIQKCDVIVNFAAETHVDRSLSNPISFYSSNYIGVSNILEILRKYPDKKLIQVSTDEVYGQISTGSWTETDKLEPRSPYSATKAAADLLISAYSTCFGINACITRSSNNFGMNQHPEKLIPKTIINAINQKPIPVYGEGKNIRDWIFVDHHITALQEIIFKGIPGNIYNIGGGNELTNLELVQKILDIMNLGYELIDYVNDRLGHDFRYSVSTRKLNSEIGLKIPSDFEEKLSKTVNWYFENRNWWHSIVLRN